MEQIKIYPNKYTLKKRAFKIVLFVVVIIAATLYLNTFTNRSEARIIILNIIILISLLSFIFSLIKVVKLLRNDEFVVQLSTEGIQDNIISHKLYKWDDVVGVGKFHLGKDEYFGFTINNFDKPFSNKLIKIRALEQFPLNLKISEFIMNEQEVSDFVKKMKG